MFKIRIRDGIRTGILYKTNTNCLLVEVYLSLKYRANKNREVVLGLRLGLWLQ